MGCNVAGYSKAKLSIRSITFGYLYSIPKQLYLCNMKINKIHIAMKKFFCLVMFATLLVSCHSNSNSKSIDKEETALSTSDDYSAFINTDYVNYDESEVDEDTNVDEYMSDGASHHTIQDINGNYYYVYTDGEGHTTINDINGNYVYADTDESGHTTMYDLNGNYAYADTDELGHTTMYDLNENYSYSDTDDCRNTTGYDLNGNYYRASTDDFGNTTIVTY